MINIQSDTRKIKPGDTFVALRGISSDGHSYIEKAIEAGATKIIAEEGDYSVKTIIVENTRDYLNDYLKENYQKYLDEMNIIAITGTNGKTTTAMLLHDALNLLGSKTAYLGTIGFYIGDKVSDMLNTTVDICDTYNLLMEAYEQGCNNVVMEVSSEGAAMGRIKSLQFDYAIFTNLTQDHLNYHKTMGNYALAKQKVFKHLKEDGIAIINIDDKYHEYFLLSEKTNYTYGFQESNFNVLNYQLSREGSKFQFTDGNQLVDIETNLLGKYNIYNIIAIISLLKIFGIKYDKIKEVIKKLKAPVGRMEMINYSSNKIIIDFAHSADAIDNVMEAMVEISPNNIYTVFGCTGDRDRIKRPIMTNIVAKNSKYFIITNDDPHNEDPNQIVDDMIKDIEVNNYEVELDREKAIIKGINLLKEKDVLLILGKGHEEFMVVKQEKISFNDKKVVESYLSKINKLGVD